MKFDMSNIPNYETVIMEYYVNIRYHIGKYSL